MHALPSYPRSPLAAGLIALVLALVAMAAAAPDLGSIDLSFGGGSSAADTPATVAPQSGSQATATWATDPLAPPVDSLR